MDEFDIEKTSLREPEATTNLATSDSIHHTGHDACDAAQSGIRALLGNRLAHPRRLWRTLIVVTTILLALAFILGANPTTRTALDAILHPVTTFSDSTAHGAEQFDFVHVAPWGDLRIDGLTVPKKHVLQRFRAISLAPGAHTLDYSAPPFAPLHCTLTVPADTTSDTCPLSQPGDDLYMLSGNDSVRVLDLKASFLNLSREQLAALIKAVDIQLLAASPTAILAPGEHYLTASGDIAVASQPLQATLQYSLSNDPSRFLSGFQDLHCQTLCFYSPLVEQAPDEWGVVAHATFSWSYAAPHSALYGPVASNLDTEDVGLPLHITWQHGWHVSPLKARDTAGGGQFSNPICMPADEMLNSLLAQSSFQGSTYTTTPASGAEGCLIRWSEWSDQNTYGPSNYLLYRFGVLLAANDEARHTFPTLPVADASEQAIAQQLATHG